MPSEAEFEDTPDAVEGRKRLLAALSKIDRADREAFWEAVKRCYGARPDEAGASS